MDDEKEQDDATKAAETKPDTDAEEEGSESDDNNGDEYFEVEKILEEHRLKADGQLYYKIRWKGYSQKHDSLEPASEIAHCVEVIAEWEKTKAALSKSQGIQTFFH
jgi:Chromo (CHRromatin Organisation MOdifier) domain